MVSIEVRILLILLEVCDQESFPVARFRGAEPLSCHRALSTVALLEDATISGLSGAF